VACTSPACSKTEQYQEPRLENPALTGGVIRITAQDGPKILSVSQKFAVENGFSFHATSGPDGFTLLMRRKTITIQAHNRIEREMPVVRITDSAYSNQSNMDLAQRYMDLVRAQSTAKRRPNEMS
jgi:hypothetical protein